MEHRDDDDDDDDVSFAKWMSSFWGHSWRDKDERGLREHHRPQDASYRKASLPCPFPVLPSITSSDCYPRRHSHEDQEFQNHPPMWNYRKSSVDESFRRPVESKRGSHPKIQEFSDSFEQQLCLKAKHTVSSGPRSRKERNGRHSLRAEARSSKKVEGGRSSREEDLREGHRAPLGEKG
uniref:Leukemia NUP98 fusion partner 1 n=2 Tax=Jaculus jaculus TaxID=51337 RepID=A0A8C5NZL5_JACJA